MKRKKIGITIAAMVILGLGFIVYNRTNSDRYVPDEDEIALHIQLDTKEDIGLLIYD